MSGRFSQSRHVKICKTGLGIKRTAVCLQMSRYFCDRENEKLFFTCCRNIAIHSQVWLLSHSSFLCRDSFDFNFLFSYFIFCRRLDFLASISFPLKINQNIKRLKQNVIPAGTSMERIQSSALDNLFCLSIKTFYWRISWCIHVWSFHTIKLCSFILLIPPCIELLHCNSFKHCIKL